MKKIFISIAIILYFCTTSYSQTPVTTFDHSKYWYYRWRLINRFLHKGESNYGCSLPFPDVPSGHSIPAVAIDYHAGFDANLLLLGKDGTTRWGDGTSYLGRYIAVLATEYRLLKNYGQATTKILEEIYYAMKAYERLDLHSGILAYPRVANCPSNPDGFFVRDDANQPFVNQFFPYSKAIPGSGHFSTFASDYEGENIDDTKSKFLQKDVKLLNPESSLYPSADQISELFGGFALVVKCFDPSENYNGYRFVDHAKSYTASIGEYLNSNYYELNNPETGQLVVSKGRRIETPLVGYGLQRAAERIVGNGANYGSHLLTPYVAIWLELQTLTGDAYQLIDSGHKYNRGWVENLAAIGSSWEYGLVSTKKYNSFKWCFNFFGYHCIRGGWNEYCYTASNPLITIPILDQRCSPFPLPNITVPATYIGLSRQGAEFGTEIYALLNQYLNNEGNPYIQKEAYRGAIHSAPCTGPYYIPEAGKYGTTGWKADSRWERGRDEANNGSDSFHGAFNGLDYMLLYNLYFLVNAGDVGSPVYINELNATYNNKNFTTNNRYYGFEDMNFTGNNSVPQNASVNFESPDITIIGTLNIPVGATVSFDAPVNGVSLECNFQGNAYQRVSNISEPNDPDTVDSVAYINDYYTELNKQIALAANWDSINVEINKRKYVPLDAYEYNLSNGGIYTTRKSIKTNKFTTNDNEEIIYINDSRIYPNPFDNKFTIEFNLSEKQQVSISIINILGQKVDDILKDQSFEKGNHKIDFDTSVLPNGTYYYKLETNLFSQIKQILKINK